MSGGEASGEARGRACVDASVSNPVRRGRAVTAGRGAAGHISLRETCLPAAGWLRMPAAGYSADSWRAAPLISAARSAARSRLELLHPAADELALQAGEVVHEHRAVQVIGLVLQRDREQPVAPRARTACRGSRARAPRPSRRAPRPRPRRGWRGSPRCRSISPSSRTISGFTRWRSRWPSCRGEVSITTRRLLHGDLRRGEPDAVGGVHGLGHVVEEPTDVVVDAVHGERAFLQDRDLAR